MYYLGIGDLNSDNLTNDSVSQIIKWNEKKGLILRTTTCEADLVWEALSNDQFKEVYSGWESDHGKDITKIKGHEVILEATTKLTNKQSLSEQYQEAADYYAYNGTKHRVEFIIATSERALARRTIIRTLATKHKTPIFTFDRIEEYLEYAK